MTLRRVAAPHPPTRRTLALVATLSVVALLAAGAASADISATASGNGLTVSVSAPTPVLSGVTDTYTVSVTNTSTSSISSVGALVDLPDGLTLKTASANCVKNPLGGRSTVVAQCTFGTLAPGASGSAVVGLLAPAPGTYTVNVDGTYQVPLPSGFEIFNTSASLGLVGVSASIGSCSSAGNAIHCDVGTLPTGQQSNIVITAVANATGSITDTASIGMTGPDTQPANNSVSVTVQPK